jgi:23S rRNA (uridine2552-2'-O)-methyltransferase
MMERGGNRGSGARHLAVQIKRVRRRKPSSAAWLTRQLNDPFVTEAKRLGHRSRAAFKLLQLHKRFRLLTPGRHVVDLGCAPGGWTQVAVTLVRPERGGGRVVGIDLKPTEPIPGATILQGDFRDPEMAERVRAALGGSGLADLVLSDMAAPATGHAPTDHLRIVALAEDAFAFAVTVLRPGGAFVAKVLQGGAEAGLLAALKRAFAEVRHAKPAASRAESAETYVVARGFRGGA